jgi:hypothetical protein
VTRRRTSSFETFFLARSGIPPRQEGLTGC